LHDAFSHTQLYGGPVGHFSAESTALPLHTSSARHNSHHVDCAGQVYVSSSDREALFARVSVDFNFRPPELDFNFRRPELERGATRRSAPAPAKRSLRLFFFA
jgi:hypothetical protein|tara:strand:+ start:2241 stop:2549 length:309 start_codon:yes stop_codon:yes gene_type:complete